MLVNHPCPQKMQQAAASGRRQQVVVAAGTAAASIAAGAAAAPGEDARTVNLETCMVFWHQPQEKRKGTAAEGEGTNGGSSKASYCIRFVEHSFFSGRSCLCSCTTNSAGHPSRAVTAGAIASVVCSLACASRKEVADPMCMCCSQHYPSQHGVEYLDTCHDSTMSLAFWGWLCWLSSPMH